MNYKALYTIFLSIMLFNGSSSAKPQEGIDYRKVVPAYIDYINRNMNMSLVDQVNEKILVRHIFALRVPEVSALQYALNAKKALEKLTADIVGCRYPSFTPDSCAALKIALEKESLNTRNEVDQECYKNLLEEYQEYGPVPQEALDAVEQRMLTLVK